MGQGESIVVVGGGIAGLTAAFRLQRLGYAPMVLEASGDVGGRMATLSMQDFRVDLAVTIFPSSYHCITRLVEDAGLGAQVMPTCEVAGVMREGRIHRTRGSSKLDGLMTKLLSLGSKILLLRALFDAARVGERLSWENLSLAATFDTESAAAYAKRRLNEELYEYLVSPICRTFCLASAEDVSAVNLLFVLRHFVGVSFFNSATGVDFLPRGLARQLEVHLDAPVRSVRETAGGVEVIWSEGGRERTALAAGCIIALPAPQMADIHTGLDPVRRELAHRIDYAPAIGVHFGLRSRPQNETAAMIQIPASESADLVGMIIDHNKAPGRAPEGKGLVSTLWRSTWSGQRWDRDDRSLVEEAAASTARLFPGMLDDIECAHVQRWRFGPDIPHPGVHQAMTRFHAADDPRSRIRLAGDYLATTSSNAAAVSAERAVRELDTLLRSSAGSG